MTKITTTIGARTFEIGDLPFSRDEIKDMKEEIIDDSYVQKWFDSVKSARATYLKGFALFCHIMGKSPTDLINIRYEDMDSNGKQDTIKSMIVEFRKYLRICPHCLHSESTLTQDCPKCGKLMLMAPKSRSMVDGGVRGFWTNLIGRKASINIDNMMEKESTVTDFYQPSLEDVGELIRHTNSSREKLVIYLIFQTGVSKSDYFELKYTQNVKDQLDRGEQVIIFEYIRIKSPELGKRKTAICYEAVQVLKDYSKTYNLQVGEPILVGESRDVNGKRKAMTDRSLSDILSRVIERTGIELGGSRFSTHAGRKFVTSVMTDMNLNEKFINFVTGHKLGEPERVYWFNANQSMRDNYTKIADKINPFKAEIQETIILKDQVRINKEKIKTLEDQMRSLENMISKALNSNGATIKNDTLTEAMKKSMKETLSAKNSESGG